MARIELEGMSELLEKISKMGLKGQDIKKKALDRAGTLVKESMESKAPRSDETKRHMADHIKVSEIQRQDGLDYVIIGPNKGDNSEFFYSKFTEWGTSKIAAVHWAENSVRENRAEINRIIKEELERGLEDEA